MSRFSVVMLPALLAAGVAMSSTFSAVASEPSAALAGQPVQWKIWGGEATFRWKRELLVDYGIEVSAVIGGGTRDAFGRERVGVRGGSALDFAVDQGSFAGFLRGSLGFSGGFDIATPQGAISLRGARLVPRIDDPFLIDLVGSDGVAWFYIDRLMYEIEGGSQAPVLAIKAADLRIGKALADFLGDASLDGMAVADISMVSAISSNNGDPRIFEPQGSSRWPGEPVPGVSGATYQADVFMHHFSTQIMMQGTDYFEPAGGHKFVLAPSSTLRNNRSNGAQQATVPCGASPCPSAPAMLPEPLLGESTALHAADVAWHQKFSSPQAPYGNDQHPYLIWNLYRIDADGRIDQVARSGVKHAWLTTNSQCDSNPGNGHILGRGCVDTYSQYNNDDIDDLGPRSEIIPATAQWGRCGSVYDKDCNGAMDSQAPCINMSGGNTSGCQNWAFRMAVPVSQIDPALHPGATYWVESWYIVRDDINIFNTMQTRGISFSGSGTSWTRTDGAPNTEATGLKLGPAVDRWLARGTNTAMERSSDIVTSNGQARLAVKVTALPGGGWRYDYVVANFDFTVAETSGAEPNLRVLSNTGFIRFEVTAEEGTPAVAASGFSDGDRDAGNDWDFSQTGDLLSWVMQGGTELLAGAANPLNWGTMYRFSVESASAPVAGMARLNAPGGLSIDVETLVPASAAGELPQLLSDGFEGDGPAE